jgi:hypothetical protein
MTPHADPHDSTPRTPLAAAVVAEAVRRIEAAGPLDDQAELRQAFHTRPTRAAQVLARAWLLGQRLGLPAELARWRHLGGWVVLGLAVAVALAGLGAARGVLAPDGGINAVAAFVGLLGLHALTLLAWLLGLAWSLSGRGGGAGGWSLGRLALGLAARLPLDRGPHALTLLRAFSGLVQRQRLWPWLTGALSHAIWTLALALTLGALAFGFAFHAYRLSWETTILGADFFQRFVQLTGRLPAALGFPVPDASAVQRAGQAGASAGADAAVQRAWAWWLMGCVAVYGVLPRALLAALSFWRWRAGLARLAQVDMADPYVRRIVQRLDALEPPPEVIDPEHRPDRAPAPPALPPGAPGTLAVVGFELPPELAWPPPGLPAASGPALRIAGGARERAQALGQLMAARPASLLLVCHAPSSPDRGTARFLREAAFQAGRSALLLVAVQGGAGAPVPEAAARRWGDWLQAEDLPGVALLSSAAAAADWVASAHA